MLPQTTQVTTDLIDDSPEEWQPPMLKILQQYK